MIWGFVLRPFRFSDESSSDREIFRGTRQPTSDNVVNNDKSTMSSPITAFGDNEELEQESDSIFDYSGSYDSKVYGY